MVTVKVCYERDGKPARGKRVSLGFSWLRGMTNSEYTNSEGEAHFDTDSGTGDVYVGGKKVYSGRIAGRVVVYI